MKVADARSHRLVRIPREGRGVLRVRMHLTCTGGTVGATDVRVLLMGDVLLRAAEAAGQQVMHECVRPGLSPEEAKALDRAVSSLGVHPPGTLPGRADVHVCADVSAHREQEAAERGGGAPEVWIEVGRVRPEAFADLTAGLSADVTTGLTGLPAGLTTSRPGADGADPLAVRLALLDRPYGRPVELRPHDLAEAARSLRRWRSLVAEWARTPSRPIPEELRLGAEEAIAEDLNTPAVVNMLRHVETTQELLPGAKFETAAYLDRVLGLDLVSEVGRV